MISDDIVFVCCPDMAGQVRGKGFPLAELERRRGRGVGWVPTNIQITSFDVIADTPFGPFGDLLLVPDLTSEVRVDFSDGSPLEHFILGDILHTDGTPWGLCLRNLLRRALADLKAETGLDLIAAFEQEFHFVGEERSTGSAYSLDGLRAKKAFGETFLAALKSASIEPDSYLREYGADQYEVTVKPAPALAAADQAVVVRQLAKATAWRRGEQVSFTPLRTPDGVGNGVHIHMSFQDAEGQPATRDPGGADKLAETPARFVAGILKYLPSILALTAPSIVSYTRLTPHRWSSAWNNLGYRDREAAVRICPVAEVAGLDPARQFNFEFRAGDAAASPHLQLAAVVLAGLAGIREGLAPAEAREEDLSVLSDDELSAKGYERLPQTLEAALARLEGDATVAGWLPERFVEVYLKHKRGEVAALEGKDEAEVCAAYERVY